MNDPKQAQSSEKDWYAPEELAGKLIVKIYSLTEEEIAERKAFLEELKDQTE